MEITVDKTKNGVSVTCHTEAGEFTEQVVRVPGSEGRLWACASEEQDYWSYAYSGSLEDAVKRARRIVTETADNHIVANKRELEFIKSLH